MSSDMEELAREGMRQFTATIRVSPDLAARTFDRHRRRHALRAGLALGAAARGAVPGLSPAWPGGPCPGRPGRRLGRKGVQRRGVLLHDARREPRRQLHRPP